MVRVRASEAIEEAQRSRRSVALLVFDLNGFKEVNDSLGHQVGDQLLKAFSSPARASIRAEDTFARIGGDEFVLLLPSTVDRVAATLVGAKLLASIGEPLDVGGVTLTIRASMGVAVSPGDGHDYESLFAHADAAMYAMKRLSASL